MNHHEPNADIFEVFPWNSHFETGIKTIDEQHQELVRLLNKLAARMGRKASAADLNKVLNELTDYAAYHFATEEEIWKEACSDGAWLETHEHSHHGFKDHLNQLRAQAKTRPHEDGLDDILSFLINWLAYHILDQDIRMAKAIGFMKAGDDIATAKAKAAEAMGGTMQKLIEAILSMYGNLSSRTLELMKEKTERRRVERALAASQKQEKQISDALMDSIPGILYLYDTDMRLVRWNRNLGEVTGYSQDELAGKSAYDFLPPEQHQALDVAVERATHDGYQEFEADLLLKSGGTLPYKLTGVATHIHGKRHFSGVGIDISRERESESHLIASRNMLEQAQQVAHLGHWTIYHDTGRVVWSDEMYQILELDKDTITPNHDVFYSRIHPDDRERVERAFEEAISSHQPYDTIHRLQLPGNRLKYVEGRSATDYSARGIPLKSVGTLHDISRIVQAERSAAKNAEEAKQALLGTVTAVAKALEARDPYTAGHQERVAMIAVRIAERMKLTPHHVEGIRLGARIHDLGKLGVPAELLSKPTRLNDMEYGLIKCHAQTGADIVQDIVFPWPISEIVAQHHERLDGSGYPLGLKGDDICFEARIVAVADVFEAMSAHRPYRPALGMEKAVEELRRNMGIHYDAPVVTALLDMIEEDPTPFQP